MAAVQGDAFGFRNLSRRLQARRRTQNIINSDRDSPHFSNKPTNVDSWSKSAGKSSSPLQVRRRVRAVLQKAKTRTGIENTSIKPEASLVAEAASIGALPEEILIEIKPTPDLNTE